MASTITASASGFTHAPDATGALELRVAGGTTALSLSTAGAIGVGSSPSYGTSGQVLTSNGTGSAPQWAAGGATTGKAIAMALIFGF
jgi:hypothetical protein